MAKRIWPSEDNELDKHRYVQTTSHLKSDLNRKRTADTMEKSNKSEEVISATAKKSRPEERPTNIRVSRLTPKEISGLSVAKKGLDPRFDGRGSQEDQHLFHTAYKFIDDIRKTEIQELEQTVKKTKDQDLLHEYKSKIDRLKHKVQKNEVERERTKLFSEYKRQEKQLVSQGKTPFYLKQSSIKNLGTAAKYLELEKSGKVDKLISKKRTRSSTKDRKYMPSEY